MNDASQRNYSWCQRIYDELKPPSTQVAGTGFDFENEPEWVQNIVRELVQQAAPTIELKKPKYVTPTEVGLYLGQQRANLYAIGELMEKAGPENLKQSEKVLKILEAKRNSPGVESFLKAIEPLDSLMAGLTDYFPVFEKTLYDAFKAALDQPRREDAAEFFQGFAKGISRPGLSSKGLAGATTATLIYEKLHVHRREVEQLQNYPALREFLVRNGVAENVVGSVRRIQKLCERVGLHLGKRGRPPKTQ